MKHDVFLELALLFLFFVIPIVSWPSRRKHSEVLPSIVLPDKREVDSSNDRQSTRVPLELWKHSHRRNQRKPRKKHLKKDDLMGLMGNDWRDDIMSIERPNDASREELIPVRENVREDFMKAFDRMNITASLRNLITEASQQPNNHAGFNHHKLKLLENHATDISALFRLWLARNADCPVHLKWTDMGPYFWPPWVRLGECRDDEYRSCSFPPGQHCVPGLTGNITLLRWHCKSNRRHRGKVKKKSKCGWLRVPYPVTLGCYCSC